jgi:hypothetical protein
MQAFQSVRGSEDFIACGLEHGSTGNSYRRLIINKKDTKAESGHKWVP